MVTSGVLVSSTFAVTSGVLLGSTVMVASGVLLGFTTTSEGAVTIGVDVGLTVSTGSNDGATEVSVSVVLGVVDGSCVTPGSKVSSGFIFVSDVSSGPLFSKTETSQVAITLLSLLLIAAITVFPSSIAVTFPVELTVATFLLVDSHITPFHAFDGLTSFTFKVNCCPSYKSFFVSLNVSLFALL